MMTLRKIIKDFEKRKMAVGHFNISELSMLKAVFAAAFEISSAKGGSLPAVATALQAGASGGKYQIPLIIGVSEGEREFMGVRQAAALIKSLREEYGYPIFINADHTHSLEKVEEAAKAGYDAILFDGGALPLEENIKQTKKVVAIAKKINPDILIEGELGFIGSGSVIRKELPKGAAIKLEDLTKPEEAARFVKETGVDLLAPAVGNIHGMLARRSLGEGGFATGYDYPLNIEQIKAIKNSVKIPLVLHGGSGNTDEDFLNAIGAGVSIIHISTELRAAWRRGMEESLRENPEEIAPYKFFTLPVAEVKKAVYNRLKLFNRL